MGVPTTEAKFWAKAKRVASGCLEWQGWTCTGYGRIGYKGKYPRAHVLAWEFRNGPVPAGLCVCHNCPGGDNRLCIDPDHMFLGTKGDNTWDAYKKERMPIGERSTAAKLTNRQVVAIREGHALGIYYKTLANAAGVSGSTIQSIINGSTWKHLPGGKRRKIGKLSPEQRKELAQLKEQGYTFKEIGAHFGISRVSAHKSYHRSIRLQPH